MPDRQPPPPTSEGFAWGPDPDEPPRLFIPILRPGVGFPAKGILLRDDPEEIRTHWVEGRSVPCRQKRENCPSCIAGQTGRRYYYYLAWGNFRGRQGQVLLEVTSEGYMSCDALREPGKVGRTLTLTRHGHVRGHVSAALGASRVHVPRTALVSIRKALESIWAGIGLPITPPPAPPDDREQIPL